MKTNSIKFNPNQSLAQSQPLRPSLKANCCDAGSKLNYMTHDNVKLTETLGNKINLLA